MGDELCLLVLVGNRVTEVGAMSIVGVLEIRGFGLVSGPYVVGYVNLKHERVVRVPVHEQVAPVERHGVTVP